MNENSEKQALGLEEKNTAVQVIETHAENVPVKNDSLNMVQTIDLSSGNIAEIEKQLESAIVAPFELTDGYWTPTEMGESKKVLLKEIKPAKYANKEGEEIELETAFLVEIKNGVAQNVSNASFMLVKSLSSFNVGSAFLITYLGRNKQCKNGNMGASWSIKPLMIKM